MVISDFRDGWPPSPHPEPSADDARAAWLDGRRGPPPLLHPDADRGGVEVVGGYLERLPLACVRHGLVDRAEIWHYDRADTSSYSRDSPVLARRGFRLAVERSPFASNDMLGFVEAFGAPDILCVWGLGVDERLLRACRRSIKIYNSIDAPALRIPIETAALFDLILTAAEWQSDDVGRALPEVPCAVLPIGPEFADAQTFRPLGSEKPYDIVYVAAAQAYKRHDILFDALARLPRSLRALCVFGYGEMADELRRRADADRLSIDFVGPPGVPFAEVNRLMNLARLGVVCGIEDGAPAILTEYMLAGLPVLANAELACGRQYILPSTGLTACARTFHDGIMAILERPDAFDPRSAVLARWTWPHSIRRLEKLIREQRSSVRL